MCNTYNEIIQEIRNITNGKSPEIDISDILYKNKCNCLLYLYQDEKYKKKLAVEKFISKMAVIERYKSLAPFFDSTELNYAVIKGAVLSLGAYNDPFMRSSGDIDILIDKKDSDKIKKELKALGFVQGRITKNGILPFSREEILFQTSMTHQTAPYVKETGNKLCPYVNVDVNTDIMWGESTVKKDMSFFLQHTDTVKIKNFKVKKLLPEAEFISLCLHHYKDFNSIYLLSEKGLCLGQYCDIFFYLKSMKPNISSLLALARQLEICEYIYYCLYYTNLIFDDDNCRKYMSAFDEYKNINLLSSFGLCEDEKKEWDCDFFERVLLSDINEILRKKLTINDLEKIRINHNFM